MNWLSLLSTLLPTATNFFLTLTHPDGTTTVIAKLDQVDKLNTDNETEINKFLASLNMAGTGVSVTIVKPPAGPAQPASQPQP